MYQYEERPYQEPERNLWAAMLAQAIQEAELDSWHPTNRRLRTKARAWLVSDEMRVGSFRWVCRVLDLTPGFIRRRLGISGGNDGSAHLCVA